MCVLSLCAAAVAATAAAVAATATAAAQGFPLFLFLTDSGAPAQSCEIPPEQYVKNKNPLTGSLKAKLFLLLHARIAKELLTAVRTAAD